MSSTANPYVRHLPMLRRYATAGAWFFIAASLLHLAWVIWSKWADPSGTIKLYHSGDVYNAWGLTYTGTLGLLSAMGQATIVLAAATASVLPGPQYLTWRRLGLGLLCAWAGLWAIDFIQLARVDAGLDSYALAFLGCVFLGCTIGRAVMQWQWRRAGPTEDGSKTVAPKRDPDFDRALESGLGTTPPEPPHPEPPEPEPEPVVKNESRSAWAIIGRGIAAICSRLGSLVAAAWGVLRRRGWPLRAAASVRCAIAVALAWIARHLGHLADRLRPAAAPEPSAPAHTGEA